MSSWKASSWSSAPGVAVEATPAVADEATGKRKAEALSADPEAVELAGLLKDLTAEERKALKGRARFNKNVQEGTKPMPHDIVHVPFTLGMPAEEYRLRDAELKLRTFIAGVHGSDGGVTDIRSLVSAAQQLNGSCVMMQLKGFTGRARLECAGVTTAGASEYVDEDGEKRTQLNLNLGSAISVDVPSAELGDKAKGQEAEGGR